MANKKKNKYGNPQKNIEAQQAAEAARLSKEVDRALSQQSNVDKKPLIMRIVVLAIAAVMILGVVVGAALGM